MRVVPELGVHVDGAPLDRKVARHLSFARIRRRLSLPALCELEFALSPESAGDLPACRPGATLSVTVDGPGHSGGPLFEGDVTALAREVTPAGLVRFSVRGMDALHRLQKRRATRTLGRLDAIGLARQLAGEVGLDVVCADGPGPEARVREHIVQWRQTDLELLVDEAQRAGWYATLEGQVLRLVTLAGAGDEIPLAWPETLRSVAVEANAAAAARSATVAGWNAVTAEPVTATVEHEGKNGTWLSGAPPANPLVVGECVVDDDDARVLARSELATRAARAVCVRGIAEGDAALVAGARIALTGLGAPWDGTFVVTEATHTIDAQSGWRTEFDTTPPAPVERDWGTITTLGNVIDVADPEGLGRVRVAFGGLGDVDSLWIGVALPAAGSQKGLLALPDEGDRVLVLLPRHDPAHAVIVGGLYGSGGVPDADVGRGATRRYALWTPAGQKLTLDDGDERVKLEIANGSFVELAPDAVTLHAESDLNLEAPGARIAIRGRRIDFEEA